MCRKIRCDGESYKVLNFWVHQKKRGQLNAILFDHSSYLELLYKYYLFCYDLFYH